MKTIWYSNLTEEEAQLDFKKSVLSALHVLERLTSVINDKTSTLNTVRADDKAYTVASWPYYQSHLNGKEEAYQEILSILNVTNPEE